MRARDKAIRARDAALERWEQTLEEMDLLRVDAAHATPQIPPLRPGQAQADGRRPAHRLALGRQRSRDQPQVEADARSIAGRMRTLLRERYLPMFMLLAGCAIGPIALLHFLGSQQVQFGAEAHFLPIAISAGLAAGAAVALTVVGARRGDGRAVLVGTAFSTMAALLAVHGLTTPGLLAGENGVVAFAGAATLPVGGAVLALSALPEIRRPGNVVWLLWLQGVLLGLVAALGLAGILAPEIVPGVPESGSTAAWIVLVIGMSFFGMLAVRAARTYLLTRRRADLLVVLGIVLLGGRPAPGAALELSGPRLVARARARTARDRPRRRSGGARPPARRAVALAVGRPSGNRARQGG